jgi:hypothetical protein
VNFPIDIFCYDFNIDENGNIINSKPKDVEYYESQLLNYIPKELILIQKTPVYERKFDSFLEKLPLNPNIKDYRIIPEKKNNLNLLEHHCFNYINNENQICIPIFQGNNNMKIILSSIYNSDKNNLINYTNLINTIFELNSIKMDNDQIVYYNNSNKLTNLILKNDVVQFWFY